MRIVPRFNEINAYCSFDSIIDLSCNGESFYYFENLNNNAVYFNLPSIDIVKFDILTKNNVQPLKNNILQYDEIKLPPREKNHVVKDYINIEIAKNPNKASTKILEAYIKLDTSFLYKPLPFTLFVLLHELGHNYYSTEKFCDMWATNEMLKLGYNPSQCFYSNFYCLSDAQTERKKYQFEYLKKVNFKILEK
jgi:hypothetical protein